MAQCVVQTSMLKFIRMFGKLSRLTHQEKTGYLFTIVPVSYTHLDVYKRQHAPPRQNFPA